MPSLISHHATATFALALIAAVAAPSASAQRAAAPDSSAGRDMSRPFRYPSGIALDPSGAVYVSSAGDSSIAVFAPGASGSAVAIRRIGGPRSGLVSPQGVALDSRGRVHASSGSHRIEGAGSLTVYAPGAGGDAAPVRVILGLRTRLNSPGALALGPDGKIYVANSRGGGVVVFDRRADGDVAPEWQVPAVADSLPPTDIAIVEDGNLLVQDALGLTLRGRVGPLRRKEIKTGPADWDFGVANGRPRFAVGPGGEVYIAQELPPEGSNDDGPLSHFFGTPTVFVYPPVADGDTTPLRKIAGKRADLFKIADLAVGRDGSLYVLSHGKGDHPGGRVLIYPPGADGDVAPVRIIAGPRTGMTHATSLTLDRRGRIYVTNDGHRDHNGILVGTVMVFAPDASGDAAPIRSITGRAARLSRPADAAVAEDGTLFVVNEGVYNDDQGSMRVYAAGAGWDDPPLRTIVGTSTWLVNPGGVAVDRGDTLYAISRHQFGGGRVTVYPPGGDGGAGPVRILEGRATEMENPRALALDGEGRLYVADHREASGVNAYGPDLGAVRVYRPGAEGNEAPIRSIMGAYTRLNGPGGLAVDRAGNVYVPNMWGTGPGSVTVYGPQDSGDVRPLRIIAGPATGLGAPSALSLDSHDTLYVVNSGTVTVYAPGAKGNAAPARTIGRPRSGANKP